MNTLSAAGLPHASQASLASVKGSSVTSLFLAAIIPFVLLKLMFFFTHTWPNMVYRLLTSRLERQIATVEERVFPNRLIQDDIMIRSVMGYVSYCYLRTLRSGANACDAVNMADYSYTFLYENDDNFSEDWIPYSPHYKTLFGRAIVAAMELSVLPTTGQAIQVEPGLFVRSMTNKHVSGNEARGEGESESNESGDDSRAAQKGERGSREQNQMDRLNQYAFYDMRKFAENMDEHAQPAADGNTDDLDSVERPFDPPARNRKEKKKAEQHSKAKSSLFFDNNANPKEESILVIEYRHPLPFEKAQALCDGHNTAGVATAFDATRAAGDVIEGFLSRAHAWYLGHVKQRKTLPLMALYPTPMLTLFTALGAAAAKRRAVQEGDFAGKCYVLEGVAPGAAADGTASTTDGEGGSPERQTGAGLSAAVSIGPSTVTGGHIGLGGAAAADMTSKGKTFHSLFFPGKARVLSLVDDFVQERGCYGVPGVVARLNFFLHGAPGTGKTSFVKALARYLHRNLVVVSMGEVVTVDELRRLLQPFELNIGGEKEDHYGDSAENTFAVRPHQSIYVFEDFDAIGDAWQALKRDQSAREIAAKLKKEAEEEASEKSGEGKRSGTSSGDSAATSNDDDSDDSDDDDCGDGSDEDGSGSDNSNNSSVVCLNTDKFLIHENKMAELERTHLTVESFLELFNGFNLPDSFIAVFTTNHPERVHPLITSSNMMDVVLDMGMLDDDCATQMVEHYFVHELEEAAATAGVAAAASSRRKERPHLSKAQAADLRAALTAFNKVSGGISGAHLEKMCVECDTIEQLTQRLCAADTWEAINAF